MIFRMVAIAALFANLMAWSGLGNAEENPPRQGRLVMGFYARSITDMASRSDIEVSLNFWAKDLITVEAKNRLNIEMTESKAILFDSMEDMHAAMQRGELDMIVAPPILIVKHFNRNELDDGYTGMLEGKAPDNLLLIVRKDQHIRSLKDLSGKRLLITADDELAEMFIDTLFLKALGKGYKNSVAAYENEKKDNRIVLDIYFNKADAGVVYRNAFEVMKELNPDIADTLVILEQYPVKSRNFGFFVKGYPYVADLSTMAIITFSENVRAKQIMQVFKTPELDYCRVDELDSFEKFDNDYKRLRKSIGK